MVPPPAPVPPAEVSTTRRRRQPPVTRYSALRKTRSVANWLAPGGTLALIDLLPDGPQVDNRALALYEVGLIRRRPAGQIHPFSSYADWLQAAGFGRVERIDLDVDPPVTLIRACRITG